MHNSSDHWYRFGSYLQILVWEPKKICETLYIMYIYMCVFNLYGRQGVRVQSTRIEEVWQIAIKFKLRWGRVCTCLIATRHVRMVVSCLTLPAIGLRICRDILWQNRERLWCTRTPCRPYKLNTHTYIYIIYKVSQIFLGPQTRIWRYEPNLYTRITHLSLRLLSNGSYHGRIPWSNT